MCFAGVSKKFISIREGHPRAITNDTEWLEKVYDPDYVLFNSEFDLGGLQRSDTEPLWKAGKYKPYEFDPDLWGQS
jgi:hypothetical protein